MNATTGRIRDVAYRLRRRVLRMAAGPLGAHVGGSLSCADILATLHFDVMRTCDTFLLSKGHAAPALYAVLAEKGLIGEAEVDSYGRPGSRLLGHPPRGLPGVEFPTGSLGHGVSLGAGMALAAAMAGRDERVFVLAGDGELQEGSVWEALMFAGHRRLGGLTVVVDRNGMQLTAATEECVGLEPLAARLTAFGWETREVDGHDVEALRAALAPPGSGLPLAVIARTVKGRGVRFLEGKVSSHYAVLTEPLLRRALAQLDAGRGAAP
ncbi:transketolase [Streptosporangium becharense]|uniref:Transketolase n=1 Tax=Streptosporangium becharense TaxID=1816182 RepID=A0A7W9MK58_9ACTN|nr:transketolase [Streptosporangium becharense]MBB2910411.1 transketolase [Streptosporangium becharense]MBB5823154.1 transketolase [Streptosporangium becharense]